MFDDMPSLYSSWLLESGDIIPNRLAVTDPAGARNT